MALTRRQLLLILLLRRRFRRTNVKRKRFWIRKIYSERKAKGECHLLVRDEVI